MERSVGRAMVALLFSFSGSFRGGMCADREDGNVQMTVGAVREARWLIFEARAR